MTSITITMIVLAVILTILGLIGAIAPALPGPPLSLAGLAIIYWFLPGSISSSLLITMVILTAVAAGLDYLAPIIITRAGGGSKRAMLFTTLGLIVGLFFMPMGLIWGPLIGAFIGEYSDSQRLGKALWVAFLSFLSFLLTTVLKIILTAVISYYIFAAVLTAIISA